MTQKNDYPGSLLRSWDIGQLATREAITAYHGRRKNLLVVSITAGNAAENISLGIYRPFFPFFSKLYYAPLLHTSQLGAWYREAYI